MQSHVAHEPYGRRHAQLVLLATTAGTASYVHGRPYILVPDLTMTVDSASLGIEAGALGRVRTTTWEGLRGQWLGNAQAWYYHEDRTLLVWECYLNEPYQTGAAHEDANLVTLWQGFERWLLERFPQTQRCVTPTTDPLYPDDDYQRFLTGVGYRPNLRGAYVREV